MTKIAIMHDGDGRQVGRSGRTALLVERLRAAGMEVVVMGADTVVPAPVITGVWLDELAPLVPGAEPVGSPLLLKLLRRGGAA